MDIMQMLGMGQQSGVTPPQQQMDPRMLQLLRELEMQKRQKMGGYQQGPVGFPGGQGIPQMQAPNAPLPPQLGGPQRPPMQAGNPQMPQPGQIPQMQAMGQGMPTPGGPGAMVNPMGRQGGGMDLQSLIQMLMQRMGGGQGQ